jgi:uncharacterized protein YdaT
MAQAAKRRASQQKGDKMPWDAKSFAAKHNHKLKGKAAEKAAEQATAMVKAGLPEGESIAVANKTGNKINKSPKNRFKK